jgi:hypothetical protein
MCESCGSPHVRWVIVDDNMEAEMCEACVKACRAEGMDVDYIDVD